MSIPPHLLGISAITENLLKRKWSVTILRYFDAGINDPAEIGRRETDLSSTAMAERLRTMLRYRLVTRDPRAGRAKSVDYRLTAKGRRVLRMLELINQLDQFADHDPRSLEDILRTDLAIVLSIPAPRPPPPVVPADNDQPVPRKAGKAKKNPVSRTRLAS